MPVSESETVDEWYWPPYLVRPMTDLRRDLDRVIQRLTTTAPTASSPSTTPSPYDRHRNVFRALVKSNPDAVTIAYPLLLRQLRKPHAHTRLLAAHLMDYLFTRSHSFRTYLLRDLGEVLALTVGLHGRALPPPVRVAQQLRADVLRMVQRWQAGMLCCADCFLVLCQRPVDALTSS